MIYQNNFSKINKSVLDKNVRTIKAKKIVAVIKDFLGKEGKPLENLLCIDIGGSTGFVAKELSPIAIKVYVVDIDKDALKFGRQNNHAPNIYYRYCDALRLPFKTGSFDIVICNQVYEHVSSHQMLINGIHRVLKKGGICYFGACNKFVLIEKHYHLPFLSWLPKSMANIYIKAMGKGKFYYENPLSYFSLRKLLTAFEIYDYTLRVIKEPKKFFNNDLIKPNSLIAKIPNLLLKIMEPCIPGYIFVLKKRGGNSK